MLPGIGYKLGQLNPYALLVKQDLNLAFINHVQVLGLVPKLSMYCMAS